MRRRQIFAQRAMEAAQTLKEFITSGFSESDAPGEITVETSYLCECGKSFGTAQGLKIHKGRAHK